jgi:FtsZ-interacting cell division protein ZipA
MDDLRLILLVAGALLVAGIWFMEMRGERRARRSSTMLGRDAQRDRDPRPVTDAAEPDAPLLPPMRALADADIGSPPSAQEVPEFIAIHVVPGGQRAFAGGEVSAAATDAGLVIGTERVFHMPGAGGPAPLFTVVNMMKPGTFEPDGVTPVRGLTMLMTLPCATGGQIVLDLMLRTADALAAALGGSVNGPDHRPLDEAGRAVLRQKAGPGAA